jgi:hypothetical protein
MSCCSGAPTKANPPPAPVLLGFKKLPAPSSPPLGAWCGETTLQARDGKEIPVSRLIITTRGENEKPLPSDEFALLPRPGKTLATPPHGCSGFPSPRKAV